MAKGSTGWAFIGTLPILGFILVMLAKKKDAYARFYAKQGLALGIGLIVGDIVLTILVITIPLVLIWNIVCFVLWILSVINAFSGKQKATPFLGRLAARF